MINRPMNRLLYAATAVFFVCMHVLVLQCSNFSVLLSSTPSSYAKDLTDVIVHPISSNGDKDDKDDIEAALRHWLGVPSSLEASPELVTTIKRKAEGIFQYARSAHARINLRTCTRLFVRSIIRARTQVRGRRRPQGETQPLSRGPA